MYGATREDLIKLRDMKEKVCYGWRLKSSWDTRVKKQTRVKTRN